MTELERFLRRAASYHDQHPHQREGQALFNALKLEREDLAAKIRETELDPFHDDGVIPAFLRWLREQMTGSGTVWAGTRGDSDG